MNKMSYGFQFILWIKPSELPQLLFTTTAALLGLACANHQATANHFFLLCIGTTLVASAGTVLNNVKNAELENKNKSAPVHPIPAPYVPPKYAKVIALLIMHGGFMILTKLPNGIAVSLLSGAAVALYNFAYAPLKRRTLERQSLFAAVLRGLYCATPLIMGWIAGKGSLISISGKSVSTISSALQNATH
jgi:heme O synthase-like polyprenyltransferase